MSQASDDIVAERERQKSVENWSLAHDDSHAQGELALAAAAYAEHAGRFSQAKDLDSGYSLKAHPTIWPWHRSWWKPKNRRRDLVRAGALILAEIERIDRIEANKEGHSAA